ncbi:MAG: hypothetical protein MI892_11325, partial [Desulfobacterales bacterium]|nr:hypothetical protein [Desulfobacterales bacterium]
MSKKVKMIIASLSLSGFFFGISFFTYFKTSGQYADLIKLSGLVLGVLFFIFGTWAAIQEERRSSSNKKRDKR